MFFMFSVVARSSLVPTDEGCQTPRFQVQRSSNFILVPTDEGCQPNRLFQPGRIVLAGQFL